MASCAGALLAAEAAAEAPKAKPVAGPGDAVEAAGGNRAGNVEPEGAGWAATLSTAVKGLTFADAEPATGEMDMLLSILRPEMSCIHARSHEKPALSTVGSKALSSSAHGQKLCSRGCGSRLSLSLTGYSKLLLRL